MQNRLPLVNRPHLLCIHFIFQRIARTIGLYQVITYAYGVVVRTPARLLPISDEAYRNVEGGSSALSPASICTPLGGAREEGGGR